MNEPKEMICPMCGSKNVETKLETREIQIPFAPKTNCGISTSHCRDCAMDGDFAKANDYALTACIDEAMKASLGNMFSRLDEKKLSMAYMERALELPPRTMMRWKNGECSAPAMALMRLITTYPFTIEVADAQYDPLFATQRMAHEGLSAVNRLIEMHGLSASVKVASQTKNSFEAHVRVTTKGTLPRMDNQNSAHVAHGIPENVRFDIPTCLTAA